MQKLTIATSNPHKVEEISAVLGQIGIACVPMEAVGIPEPDEDGATFEANARIKAIAYAKALGVMVLADDSGLEVDALGGAPGVHSARYAESARVERSATLRTTRSCCASLRASHMRAARRGSCACYAWRGRMDRSWPRRAGTSKGGSARRRGDRTASAMTLCWC